MQQQSAASEPSPGSTSFAGLLAALAAPKPQPAPAWHEDELAEDGATLSYERALRAHARYRPADSSGWTFPQARDTASVPDHEADDDDTFPPAQAKSAQSAPGWNKDETSGTMPDQTRRCASVTVRLSKAECAQLQERATAAGLSVSAYLRSCTFEAEALRVQVKDALVELRAARLAAKAEKVARESWRGWLARLRAFPGPQVRGTPTLRTQTCPWGPRTRSTPMRD